MEPGNEDSGWSYHTAQTSGWGTSENTSDSCSERVFVHRIVSLNTSMQCLCKHSNSCLHYGCVVLILYRVTGRIMYGSQLTFWCDRSMLVIHLWIVNSLLVDPPKQPQTQYQPLTQLLIAESPQPHNPVCAMYRNGGEALPLYQATSLGLRK